MENSSSSTVASHYATGGGKSKSTIAETVPAADLLSTSKNGTVVEDLTLNTQTYDGGHAFGTIASFTKLQRVDVFSGNQPGYFVLYYAGPPGASRTNLVYSQGNVVNDVDITDQICDGGFFWSFQRNGKISNVTQVGSRLALYLDNTDSNKLLLHARILKVRCSPEIWDNLSQ